MEQEKSVGTPNYVRLVLMNWYKVVAGMMICAIVGTVYALRMPRTYESTTMLLVYPPLFKEAEGSTRARTDAEAKLALDEMMPQTFPVDTYKVIAKSKEIVKAIIDELGLTGVTVEGLSGGLEVELVKVGTRGTSYSQIILFHARAGNPQRAKQVADKWANVFKARVDKLAQNGIRDTTKLIGDMWDTTKRDLEDAEDKLEEFTKESNVDSMKSRKESKEELLTTLEADLSQTEIDIAAARGELAALRMELEKEDKIERLFKAPPDAAIWLLGKTPAGDEKTTIGPKDGLLTEEYNPNYTPARDQEILTQSELQGLEGKRDKLVSAMEDLNREIENLQIEIAEKETEFKQLTRNVTTVQGTYELVAAKREKGKIALTSVASDIQIAAEAVEPENPVGTRRLFVVAAAALIGAIIGVGYVIAEYSFRAGPAVTTG